MSRNSTPVLSSIIKTTAKYHDSNEPNKLKPIIKIDSNAAEHHYYIINDDDDDNDYNNQLHSMKNGGLNYIRASIDSGRDNPFKPEGEIYRSAEPIVDYYKFGPNQSRAQSPSYDELVSCYQSKLMTVANNHETGLEALNAKNDKKKNKSKKKNKKEQETYRKQMRNDEQQQQRANGTHSSCALVADNNTGERRASCWRRWLCCGCRCNNKRRMTTNLDINNVPKISSTINDQNTDNDEHQRRQISDRMRANLEIGSNLAALKEQQESNEKIMPKQKLILVNNEIREENNIEENSRLPINDVSDPLINVTDSTTTTNLTMTKKEQPSNDIITSRTIETTNILSAHKDPNDSVIKIQSTPSNQQIEQDKSQSTRADSPTSASQKIEFVVANNVITAGQ